MIPTPSIDVLTQERSGGFYTEGTHGRQAVTRQPWASFRSSVGAGESVCIRVHPWLK